MDIVTYHLFILFRPSPFPRVRVSRTLASCSRSSKTPQNPFPVSSLPRLSLFLSLPTASASLFSLSPRPRPSPFPLRDRDRASRPLVRPAPVPASTSLPTAPARLRPRPRPRPPPLCFSPGLPRSFLSFAHLLPPGCPRRVLPYRFRAICATAKSNSIKVCVYFLRAARVGGAQAVLHC